MSRLQHEPRPGVTNQLSDHDPRTSGRRKAIVGARALTAVVAAGGLVFGLSACGPNAEKTEPRADASTSAPADPTAGQSAEHSASPSQPEVVAPPAELSMDAIRDLTPAELTERFQIKADSVSTPEEYVEAYIARQNAFYKVGCTKEDWEQNSQDPNVTFPDVMMNRYFAPIATGLNGFVGDDHNNRAVLTRCDVMFTGGMNDYSYNVELVPGSVTSEQNSDGSFNVTFDSHSWDNYAEVKKSLGDIKGTDSDNQTVRFTFMNVHPNSDGALVFDDEKSADVTK